MQVLAINGASRGKNSITYNMLKNLLGGMTKAGASTEIINLTELDINYCKGCIYCLRAKKPGLCAIKDDMESVLAKILSADLVVYGTPLYFFSMTGRMKTFLDRTLPLKRIDCQHKMLVVSPSAYPSLEQFEPLLTNFKILAKISGRQYLGEILRPTAHFEDEKIQEEYARLLGLAGEQLIRSDTIEEELLKKMHEPWMSEEEYCKSMEEKLESK
jgi:NAD(P)H-dependent FMN reductase